MNPERVLLSFVLSNSTFHRDVVTKAHVCKSLHKGFSSNTSIAFKTESGENKSFKNLQGATD